MSKFITDLLFLFERVTWNSLVDILLVTIIFYTILYLLRDTQAEVILRGVILLIIIMGFITSIVNLPAFSWLVRTAVPALLFVIPVVIAPEIRRGLERLGHTRIGTLFIPRTTLKEEAIKNLVGMVVDTSEQLAKKRYGALIVLQREDNLEAYIHTGIRIDAKVTCELLYQIFFPKTPLHDGAAIIEGDHLIAAACVLPPSIKTSLDHSPEHQLGLRHLAALGISEISDAIAVVVSEQSGYISIAHNGKLTRHISPQKLESMLLSIYQQNNKVESSSKTDQPSEKPK